jgi:hypothetical protein
MCRLFYICLLIIMSGLSIISIFGLFVFTIDKMNIKSDSGIMFLFLLPIILGGFVTAIIGTKLLPKLKRTT